MPSSSYETSSRHAPPRLTPTATDRHRPSSPVTDRRCHRPQPPATARNRPQPTATDRNRPQVFRHSKLPLRLRPYRILATSPTSGLIEVVPNAKSLDAVKKSTPNFRRSPPLCSRRAAAARPPRDRRAAPV